MDTLQMYADADDNKLVNNKEERFLNEISAIDKDVNCTSNMQKNQSDPKTEFTLDRSKSLSFDWTEFERVFASEFNTKAGFERLVSFLSEIPKNIAKYLKSERDMRRKCWTFTIHTSCGR